MQGVGVFVHNGGRASLVTGMWTGLLWKTKLEQGGSPCRSMTYSSRKTIKSRQMFNPRNLGDKPLGLGPPPPPQVRAGGACGSIALIALDLVSWQASPRQDSRDDSSGGHGPLTCSLLSSPKPWHEDVQELLAPKTQVCPIGATQVGLFTTQPMRAGEAVAVYGSELSAVDAAPDQFQCNVATNVKSRAIRFGCAGNAGLRWERHQGQEYLQV